MHVILGKGIRVSLSDFNRLRAFQSSGELWGREQQDLLRHATGLGRFLPEVTEDPSGETALFQLMVDGREVVSTSKVKPVRDIPAQEIRDFREMLTQLIELSDISRDSKADPTKVDVIKAFRLPDPIIQPEFYRVYKQGGRRRLLVLWGCERIGGSSVDPLLATQRLEARQDNSGALRTAALVALVLLLLLLGIFAWSKSRSHEDLAAAPGAKSMPAISTAATEPAIGDPTTKPAINSTIVVEPGVSASNPNMASSAAPATKPAVTVSAQPATSSTQFATGTPGPTTTSSQIASANPAPTTGPSQVATANPTPTTRPTQIATADPTPTTRPSSIATADPTPTTRPSQIATANPTPTTKPSQIATADPTPATNPAQIATANPAPTTFPALTATGSATPATSPSQPLAGNSDPTQPARPAPRSSPTSHPAVVASAVPVPTPKTGKTAPDSTHTPAASPTPDPSLSAAHIAHSNPGPTSTPAPTPKSDPALPSESTVAARTPAPVPDPSADQDARDPTTGDALPKIRISKQPIGSRPAIDEARLLVVVLSVKGVNDPGVRAVRRVNKWNWLIDGEPRTGFNDNQSEIELHISNGIHKVEVTGKTPEGRVVIKSNTLRVQVKGDAALDD